jgi:hypothetical protein
MSLFTDPNRIPENYGLRIAGGLIVFFLFMKFSGLVEHVELRALNLVILVAGIYYALKKFKSTHQDHLNYFRGLVTGVATASIGALGFTVFLFVYLKFLDTDMMQFIMDNDPMGRYLNPYISSFIILLEGVFSGFLVTFVLLNWVNTDEPTQQG